MATPLSIRVKALKLLKEKGYPFGVYMGTRGGSHVFRTKEGAIFEVDLVIEKVTQVAQ